MSKTSHTRQNILEKAFELIYKNGYQSTSVDDIIATIAVTKGAFYYYFKTKDKMGVAIINEILKPSMQDTFIIPLENSSNPIEKIYEMIHFFLFENPFMKFEYGCPTGNLINDTSNRHIEISKAMNELIFDWQTSFEKAIQRSIEKGILKNNIDPKQITYFIISSYWGIRHFSKVYNNNDCYYNYLKELRRYLDNLK